MDILLKNPTSWITQFGDWWQITLLGSFGLLDVKEFSITTGSTPNPYATQLSNSFMTKSFLLNGIILLYLLSEEIQATNFWIRADGSFISHDQLAEIVWTLSDSSNNLLAVGASATKSSSSLETELLVIFAGLLEADARGISNFLVLCDSINLVHSLTDCIQALRSIRFSSKECKWLITKNQGKILWCPQDTLNAPYMRISSPLSLFPPTGLDYFS